MFINKARLPHVLPPSLYSSTEQFDLEMANLFRPGWQVVGTVADAPHHGDFFTLELFGTPLLVRNYVGTWHTFLNVCTHRHSLLSHAARGHSATLKCQYHGWEYGQDGRTAKIPDAQSFRPIPGGPECLRKYRTEVRGPLIFVSLEPQGESLSTQLGRVTSVCDEFPGARWYRADSWSYEFPANWKVVAENTVESYHVESIHPKTLVRATAEADTDHEIFDEGTMMGANIVAPGYYHSLANWLLPKLEPNCSHRYRIYHSFPGLFLIRIDAMLQVMVLRPISPSTSQMTVSVFILNAAQETILTKQLTKRWGQLKCIVIKKILAEDAAIYPDLHRGMLSSPFQGTISTREELVYALQLYVAKKCGLALV